MGHVHPVKNSITHLGSMHQALSKCKLDPLQAHETPYQSQEQQLQRTCPRIMTELGRKQVH